MSFSYSSQRLTDPRRQLRLLQISPGCQKEPIWCEINVVTRTPTLKYVAVSYTWGSEDEVENIVVNGKLLTVRRNCFYALWQLRFHGVDLPIWIDSICLDQTNNFEKSKQVRQMGSIYANAELTVACLGHGLWLHDIVQDIEQHDKLTYNAALEPSCPRKARDHLSSLANLPYFKRLWIVQELYHAKEIVILCGQQSLPWHELETYFLEIAEKTSELTTDHTSGCEERSGLDETELARFIHFRKFRLAQRAIKAEWTDELTGHGFTGVLLTFGDGACFDPRDKIYGLLSLAQDSRWLVSFPVDYNRPLVEVLRDVVVRIGSESLTENVSRLVAKLIAWFGIQPADIVRVLQLKEHEGPSVAWSNFVTNTISFKSGRVWRIHNLAMGSNTAIPQANNMLLQLDGGRSTGYRLTSNRVWHEVCKARGRILKSVGAELWIAGSDVKPGDLLVEFDAMWDNRDEYRTVVVCRAPNLKSERLEIVSQATALLDVEAYDSLHNTNHCKPRLHQNLPVYEKQYLHSKMLLARPSHERAVIHLRPMDLIRLAVFRERITDRIHFPILSRDTDCFATLEHRDLAEESDRTVTMTMSQDEYDGLEHRLQGLYALRRFCEVGLSPDGKSSGEALVPEQLLDSLEAFVSMRPEQQADELRQFVEPLGQPMKEYLQILIRMQGLGRFDALRQYEASMIAEMKSRIMVKRMDWFDDMYY